MRLLLQELDLHDISLFDAEFGKTLQELQALVSRKQYLESIHDRNEILNLRFRGAPVEDICLDFTLPGYPEFILKTGDDNVLEHPFSVFSSFWFMGVLCLSIIS